MIIERTREEALAVVDRDADRNERAGGRAAA
jgi:hypothetical protein